MNKYYYDSGQNKEIVDMTGTKTTDEINIGFSGNFMDITQEKLDKEKEDKIITDKNAIQEALIQAKMRELAIIELKKEGKL